MALKWDNNKARISHSGCYAVGGSGRTAYGYYWALKVWSPNGQSDRPDGGYITRRIQDGFDTIEAAREAAEADNEKWLALHTERAM